MTFELLEVLNMLQLHYEQQGDNAKARKYELLYYKTKDEFMGRCMLAKVDEAALDLKLEESNEQMRELNYKHRTQGMVLWGVVIIAVLLATILVGLYVNYRKTKRTNRLLYEKSVAMLNAGTKPAVAATESVSDLNADGPTQADRELMEKITEVMENSPEIYDDSFSLQRLTELVGVNIKYVSRAINTCRQCNFKVLLNEYRIKEACRRLMDNDTYGSYTIESIGNSVGFASRSNFTTVFKNVVGITPATFQKMHRKPQ
ncbi:MAG: helix-turn-helix transcriptional regulator [Bacteroidales bacterium]|nr:helix-turn-helix transcriptional regulator [Candidatus Sodaliphilus aphodohippi]